MFQKGEKVFIKSMGIYGHICAIGISDGVWDYKISAKNPNTEEYFAEYVDKEDLQKTR